MNVPFLLQALRTPWLSLLMVAGFVFLVPNGQLRAQIDQDGCVGANFGIDADFYSGLLQFGNYSGVPAAGTLDWFQGATGRGVIDTTNKAAIQSLLTASPNPTYEARMLYGYYALIDNRTWIDAVYGRDWFGGSGGNDSTAYLQSNKNAQDPALWKGGLTQVLGKNDILDVGMFMMRDGITINGDLWFYGTMMRTEPGGSAYMDFEFFVQSVTFSKAAGFSSGGPDLGHTAFLFGPNGQILRMGDIIFNVSMSAGGKVGQVQMRLWMKRSEYDLFKVSPPVGLPFTVGTEFDGPFNGSPYGYASISPLGASEACGNVNLAGQKPAPPTWGHRGTKSNVMVSSMGEYAIMEIGFNMSDYSIDPQFVPGADPCDFPYHTAIAKTRSSESFTSELKDFAGPYQWGVRGVTIDSIAPLFCARLSDTLWANPQRNDVLYQWSTLDGHIASATNQSFIVVDKPGTYTVQVTLANGCVQTPVSRKVTTDPSKPFFQTPTAERTVACVGNDGALDLSVSGGTAPFTYSWSKSGDPAYTASAQDISGLTPGIYTVTITDVFSCTKTFTDTVPAATPMTITATHTDVSCFGGTDGGVDLSIASSRNPFTYLWSTGDISQNLSNRPAGSYSVTVTDADGCTFTAKDTILQPSPISLSVTAWDDTNPLPGSSEADGRIDLTVSGGTAGFSYLWSNGSVTQDIDSLPRGQYTVTVTDARGCTAKIGGFIWEPEICGDGIENDGDGLTDCDDPDCMPAAAPAITPSKPGVCVGDSDAFYTVTQGPVYQWTVPAGHPYVFDPAGETNRIRIDWQSTAGGPVCVRISANGCLGPPSCITVTPLEVPEIPEQPDLNKY